MVAKIKTLNFATFLPHDLGPKQWGRRNTIATIFIE